MVKPRITRISRMGEATTDCTDYTEREWVELRDGAGKLQGKWDPVAGVLEIQRRGVKTRYWLGAVGQRHD